MAKCVQFIGGTELADMLRGVSGRLMTPEVTLETQIEVLERAEEALFESYGGKYVQSGRTMASLTQSSADYAIRAVHGPALEFGTSLWYALFQRQIGGPSGKPRGRRREGPSLILRLTPALAASTAERVMGYIWGRP